MKGGAYLERARAAFKARPATRMEIPEWDGLVVWLKQPSWAELQKVIERAEGRTMEQAARLVALCCRDENGDRLFTDEEWRTFMTEIDPAPVQRIANALMAMTAVDGSAAGVRAEAGN